MSYGHLHPLRRETSVETVLKIFVKKTNGVQTGIQGSAGRKKRSLDKAVERWINWEFRRGDQILIGIIKMISSSLTLTVGRLSTAGKASAGINGLLTRNSAGKPSGKA